MSSVKRPPRRHQPKGLTIVHEDRDLLVVDKAAGLLTMGTDREKERTAYSALTDYVRKGNPKVRRQVFIVHRLDRDVSGILVFAKSYPAKKYLQENWDRTEKVYLAVVHGKMGESDGTITSYLLENHAHVVRSTPDKKRGKLSRTDYRVLAESRDYSLLEIRIATGRKHQIRVHLADSGHPVVGDRKYGRGEGGKKRLLLHAKSLSFRHPFSHEWMSFDTETPARFEVLFGRALRPSEDNE